MIVFQVGDYIPHLLQVFIEQEVIYDTYTMVVAVFDLPADNIGLAVRYFVSAAVQFTQAAAGIGGFHNIYVLDE